MSPGPVALKALRGRGAAIQASCGTGRAGFWGILLACCAHADETVSGDAREDATLKTARTASEARARRNIMAILRGQRGREGAGYLFGVRSVVTVC